MASTFGNVGQASYSAANSYMDALARSRRVQSMHGSSLQIPAVSGAGMGAIVVPNLSLCTEYTGEPILLEPQLPPGAAGDGAAGGAAMARVVPYQVDALLEALPKRLVGPNLDPPSAEQVQALFGRLAHLPDKLADLPASASALPGGAWGAPIAGGGALPVDAKRGRTGQDAFTARQRKKQALGM